MDTKGIQHCKHPKKMKSRAGNEKPEVFVLPPDILKKLGISIGNINETDEIATDVMPVPSTKTFNNEDMTNRSTLNSDSNSAETSILETAKLMKKSVFLSPTFIPTTANVIPGEVEISNKNTASPIINSNIEEAQGSVYIPVNDIEVNNSLPETTDIHKVSHKVNEIKLNCDFTSFSNTNQCNPNKTLAESEMLVPDVNGIPHEFLLKEKSRREDNPHITLTGSEMLVPDVNSIPHDFLRKEKSRNDDILKDAPISKNNSEVKCTSTIVALNKQASKIISETNVDTVTETVQKLPSKINIISEETIPLSKLRKFKSLQSSNKNSLTPVPVNTIIGSKNNSVKSNFKSTDTSENKNAGPLNKSKMLNIKNNYIEFTCKDKEHGTANIHTSTVSRDILSLETQAPSKDSVNLFNVNKNISIQSSKASCQIHLLDHSNKEDIGTETPQSSEKESEFMNENYNQVVNLNELNEHNVNVSVDGIEERKCNINVHRTYNDKTNKDTALEDSNILIGQCTEDVKEGNSKLNSDTKLANASQTIHSTTIGTNCKGKQCSKDKNDVKNMSSVNNIENKLLQNDELSNILNATKDLSTSSPDAKIGKVKEIAAYLKKFSHIYTDKKRIRKERRNDNNKKEIIHLNTNTIKSKLCIQGVEKPGGKKVDREHTGERAALKTYTRRNQLKPFQSKLSVVDTYKTCGTVETYNIEHNNDNITTSSKLQEFCICYDFGRLAYYDYENLYEHLHFWEHVSTNCELDLIFAIYSDETSKSNNEMGLINEQKTEKKLENDRICWNVFQNEISENIDISDQPPIDFVIDGSINASGDIFKVSELNPVVQNGNIQIISKSHNQTPVNMAKNLNCDIILETVDHDMVDSADSKTSSSIQNINFNATHNDNVSSAVVTTHENASAETKCTKYVSSLRSELPSTSSESKSVSSQICNIIGKISTGASAEEKNASKTKENSHKQYHNKKSEKDTVKEEVKLDLPKTIEKNPQKRRLSEETTLETSKDSNVDPPVKKNIKCGVCRNVFSQADWEDHVENEHNLIAWKAGYTIDLDDQNLLDKINQRLKTLGILKCTFCNKETKKFKKFIKHVKECLNQKYSNTNKDTEKHRRKSRNEPVTCGVCRQTVQPMSWLEHSGRDHDYLAWIHGEEPLNLENESSVWEHLQNIIRGNGHLTCYKCGLIRKRVKLYLSHVKTCDGSGTSFDDSSMSISLNTSKVEEKIAVQPTEAANVKCGVCQQEVTDTNWIEHIAKEHNYLAWKDGETPLDFDEEEVVWNHLQQFIRHYDGLTCHKCGLVRRRVKLYLTHIDMCDGTRANMDDSTSCLDANLNSTSNVEGKKQKVCGVCKRTVSNSKWYEHIGTEHNYLAWQDGDTPLDVNDEDAVWQHLQQIIRDNDGLTCYTCGLQRKRVKLYLSHVKTCDGSEDEMDDTPLRLTSNTLSKIKVEKDKMCGVCKQTVPSSNWIEHIGKDHNYLAWQEGDTPLDMNDEEAVRQHLQQIIRYNYGLTCYKCGLHRKRVKLYLSHIETCDGSEVEMDDYASSRVDLNSSTRSHVDVKEKVCGVCKESVSKDNWLEHIGKEHNYLAWYDGDTPLDVNDEDAVWQHLQQIIRHNDGLICYKCGLHRKRVKLYLAHVRTCDGSERQGDTSTNTTFDFASWHEVPITSDEKKSVKCGVCNQEVAILEWLQHMGKEHNYLAWLDGSPPLDLEDELTVREHLLNISRYNAGLICSKCDKNIKYPKTFLQHVKECLGITVPLDDSTSSESAISKMFKKPIKGEMITCGVCQNKTDATDWMNHIEKVHQYLAWVDGHTPIDLNDTAEVHKHLLEVSRILGGLKCLKCGMRRKYVKTYLSHVETCDGNVMSTTELSLDLMSKDVLECAVCGAEVKPNKWRDHAMKNHYNVAWVVGDIPIEVNSPYAVESYLKEYLRKYNKLVCKVCGISRASCVGFYAHVIQCGKSERETEMYKSVCEICNNKYLRIYKSQHMTMHREQEMAVERKLLVAKEKELKKEEPEIEIQSGRRKAAEKAKTVLEKYTNSINEGRYHCSKCGYSTEIEKELTDHVCVEDKWGNASDSDETVDLEYSEDDSEEESDVDSNISDEEREAREHDSHKKRRYSDVVDTSSKVTRLPYYVKSITTYMKRSAEEFVKTYLTDEDIFPQWHNCEIEAVLENDVSKYMPPIEESCQIKFDDNNGWKSYHRFAAKRETGDTITMFVGASIKCMTWAPAHSDNSVSCRQSQYMAVVSPLDSDAPRYTWDESPSTHGLIQIWNCGNLIASLPQFVLGIAHDFGAVWSIDWCPSGARDAEDFEPEPNKIHRLGLLGAACSNGIAYIFSIPYPSSITEGNKLFYKLKPVAELRLAMNSDRKRFQATAIKWSVQKGHSNVVVGYSDGTTAFYDLNGESPLLRATENNVTVFYPYHDERVQNACIEDVDLFPSGSRATGVAGDVVCAGTVGGAGGTAALQSHVPASRVLFPPHWPAPLLAGDDCLVNQSINEMTWWGFGRRLGGMRGAAGCAWCGRVAAAAPPLLRLMRLHPCFPEVHKQVIGAIQMTHLGSKRKQQTDELAMVVEPITYSDCVKKYGLEFKQVTGRDRCTQQKFSTMPRDAYPERFPLNDVTAMQFCPTFKHHHKLAVAMHAGVIFILSI